MKRRLVTLTVGALLTVAGSAHAIPALQLYIEGSTHDSVNESWVVTSNSFDLWVLGNVGHWGPVEDVFLAASVYGDAGNVSLTSKKTALVTDPSVSGAATDLGYLTDAQAGTTFANSAWGPGVATHAEYANADAHRYWGLGDFALTDSPIGDFINGFPTTFPQQGQINVYHVEITGYDAVHFDAFGSIQGKNGVRYVFAPFSHDAGNPVPEPGTLALLGMGIAGLAMRMRRRSV
jgi:hypothetical protein